MSTGPYDPDEVVDHPAEDDRLRGRFKSDASAPSLSHGLGLGLLATAAGLGVAELVVGLVEGSSSPVVPVGQEFIDYTNVRGAGELMHNAVFDGTDTTNEKRAREYLPIGERDQ